MALPIMKRRQFLGTLGSLSILSSSVLSALLVATVCANCAEAERVKKTECKMVWRGAQMQLQSPSFTCVLATADGLRARAWQNHLTGREISLGLGPEVALDFDAAEQRTR